MYRNRHICCVCHSMYKDVQIHHIDGTPSNNRLDNLAALCSDCHSKVTSDAGLGRRYTVGELRKYKQEWEGFNSGRFAKPESLAKSVGKELLKADISRLMVQATSLHDTTRILEAVRQIENYSIFFDGVCKPVIDALQMILYGTVWSDAKVTAACAEALHHLFWGFTSENVPLKKEDEEDMKWAIGSLEWIAEHATADLRSTEVQGKLFESLEYMYEVTALQKRSKLGLKILSVVKTNIKACLSETNFKGVWHEGLQIVSKKLKSMREVTPSRWQRAMEKIKELELSVREANRT